MTEKEHYIEKAKTKIDEWNAEIDKFKAQVAGSDADVKIEFTKQLDEMRDQRDKAETWLKELRGSSVLSLTLPTCFREFRRVCPARGVLG